MQTEVKIWKFKFIAFPPMNHMLNVVVESELINAYFNTEMIVWMCDRFTKMTCIVVA